MYSTITNNIKVSVIPEYDAKNSFPSGNKFVFRYHITIENFGTQVVKVLRREWLVFDLGFGFTEVIGDGVIGMTPEINPGESFKYFSNVVLRSGVGNMQGKYILENLFSQNVFEVDIPKFNLISEVLSN